MADVMRWRYWDEESVLVPVDSAQTIEIGDAIYLATDDGRSADQISAGSLINMQDSFVDQFIGIAAQRSKSGDTNPIRVNTHGVFEFICASATFTIGDPVGMAGESGVALENQTVIAVADGSVSGIGVVVQSYTTATTRVLVKIVSTKFSGGIQPATASS
jgi:predicted RecA/RadA family phage recombinase